MLALPVSDTQMIGVVRPVESRVLGLFGREKAPLGFRDGEKPGLGLLGRPLHDWEIPYQEKTRDQHK